MKGRLQILLLVVLVAVAAALSVRGVRRFRQGQAATAVCEAVDRRDWQSALELGETVTGVDDHALGAAECRCVAWLETGQRSACVDLLEDLLDRTRDREWLPAPILTAVTVESRRDQGRLDEAAALARQAVEVYPQDPVLLLFELNLRSRLEDEGQVLAEMAVRLPDLGEAEPSMRRILVDRYLKRKSWPEALELLGTQVPDGTPGEVHKWYRARITAFAGLGRGEDLRRVFGEWKARGENAVELEAAYAIVLSIFHLVDPETTTVELLEQALDQQQEIEDLDLLAMLYGRMVGILVVDGRFREALTYYDEAIAQDLTLDGLAREDILRSRTQDLLGRGIVRAAVGSLHFQRSPTVAGETLLISPPGSTPVDTAYEEHPVPASGQVSVRREVGLAPARWVLLDAEKRVTASGVVWPVPGSVVTVELEPGPAVVPATFTSARRPADGRRRVVVAILDCGDWRLVQFGRARGELPVFDELIEHGRRGVLLSDPPYTAIAIQAIASPAKRGVSSFVGFLHGLGSEAEALNFLGVNPFAALEWVLPVDEDLFTTLGHSWVVAANMLKSYGPLKIGRQSEIHGPHGAVRTAGGYQGARELDAEERRLFPQLAGAERPQDRALLQEMAADFDTLLSFAAQQDIDLTLLRVASLDILTHGHFAEEVRSGPVSEAGGLLAEVYRYIDRRLGELENAMDQDDILIVMSDHGIRTALEHDKSALFVAVGGELPPGRLDGQPALPGIGRMLADLFGIDTDWPATGIEELAEHLPPR